MTTDFSTLPIVDLSPLSGPGVSQNDLSRLSRELDKVFRSTGFAYLINPPLSFSHDDVFGLAHEFFSLPEEGKMKTAKRMFVGCGPSRQNTYRGYFPPQSGSPDNLKEGFEIGPGKYKKAGLLETTPESTEADQHELATPSTIHLNEDNVWPPPELYPHGSRQKLEQLYQELQSLSKQLLGLLAVALDQSKHIFEEEGWMDHSISTLRLLHYPPSQPAAKGAKGAKEARNGEEEALPKLCCTPHTDSGILTLLHQDPTGGLEVQNASGNWVPAPYLPGSLVVNIGDLMARVSGGRYVATMHRVRAVASGGGSGGDGMGRFSVPFFFEPGEMCLIRSVVGGEDGGVRYGEHVRAKMNTWVEFQEQK